MHRRLAICRRAWTVIFVLLQLQSTRLLQAFFNVFNRHGVIKYTVKCLIRSTLSNLTPPFLTHTSASNHARYKGHYRTASKADSALSSFPFDCGDEHEKVHSPASTRTCSTWNRARVAPWYGFVKKLYSYNGRNKNSKSQSTPRLDSAHNSSVDSFNVLGIEFSRFAICGL